MSNTTLTVPNNFTLTITMKSDWHVGSGSGRGEIDSIVQRDADGLPYIPAKSLTGILRDGCEQVAQALDGGSSGKWNNWVNFLFGDQPALAKGAIETEPRPASLSIQSAHLDTKLRDALSEKPKLQQAIAFIKPGVSIDGETGSAKPDFLRFEEVVRMDAVLSADFELNFSETTSIKDPAELQTVQQVCYALLIAGAKMVDRLGGKRRRGVGTCEIKVDDKEQNWLKWLETNHAGIKERPDCKPDKLPSYTQTPNLVPNGIWYKVPLKIETRSPLVLPSRTVGNVVECLDYIPGRYLLRHLHKQLGDKLNVSQAIAQNHLVITNATIEINGVAGRPTPFCLFGEKLDGGLGKGKNVYNRFQESEPDDTQLKGERGGYIGQFNNSELPEYQKIDFELYTHNTIMDEVQRPTREVGGIYSYEAIPAGLTFRAELRIPASVKKHLAEKDNNWFQKLAGNTRIGQSKKDQYGAIAIEVESPTPIQATTGSQQNLLYVWFVSDVLMRGKRLNPTVDPDDFKKALERELNVKLKEREIDDLLSMMLRQRRTESWQVRWGLPRPSMVGWQAGSCIVYHVTEGSIAPEKIAELEAKGIGDRRSEGYGQILFNDPLLLTQKLSGFTRNNQLSQNTKPKSVILSKSSNSGNNVKVSNSVFDYARLIETAAWREAIQNQAVAVAANPQKRKEVLGIGISGGESQPPMSQLGGLRSVMGKLTEQNKSNSVTGWIEAIKKVENRKEKWTGTSLNDIKELVTDFDKIWQILEVDKLSKDLTITDNGKTKLKADLWAEAVRTLVDAMIRGHKRDLEKEQKEQSEEVA